MEAISLKCPNCGAVLTVPDIYIGRTSKCGRCRHVVSIRPPGGSTAVTNERRRRTVNWYNVVMNAALVALLLLIVGAIANFFF